MINQNTQINEKSNIYLNANQPIIQTNSLRIQNQNPIINSQKMDYLKKLSQSVKVYASPHKLQQYSKQKKMEYILDKIKSTHSKLMNDITQEFQQKINYQQNVCYDQFKTDMQGFADCCNVVSKGADSRVELYKKKVAFISIVASKCLQGGNGQQTIRCKEEALESAKKIMTGELEFIKNWNPHFPHVPSYQQE